MKGWAAKVRAHGEAKQKAAPKTRKPRPVLQETWAQVRASAGNDPGEVIPVFYTVDGGVLTVTDEKGAALPNVKPHTLLPSDNPQSLARSFTLARRRDGDPNGFNRRLRYAAGGLV